MNSAVSRRALLLGASAAATLAAMPVIAAAAPPPVLAPPPMPMWAVGTIDNFDWRAVAAPTHDAARLLWAKSEGYWETCSSADPDCECEVCELLLAIEVERKPEWDGKGALTRADWLRADMSVPCNRCGEHCSMTDDAQPVGDEAVCFECMTLADSDIVDPARAAELLGEAADA